jgi:AsmA protein
MHVTDRIDQQPANARPTARSVRMRRWSGLLVLGLFLGLAVMAGAIAYSTLALKPAAARSALEARLAALTGLPVFVAGPAQFTLLPKAQLTLANIRIGVDASDADAVMVIDGIVADLDLWQALLGHARIEQLTLVRPELLSTSGFVTESQAVAPEADGKAASTPGGMAAVAAEMPQTGSEYLPVSRYIGAFLSRFGDLRSLVIRDGQFRMASAPGSLGISNANIRVTWPSKTSSARLDGAYVWNGQPTEIALNLTSPIAFLDGGLSVVDLSFDSPALNAGFEGEAAIGGDGRFVGTLTASAPSLTRAIRWLGHPKSALPDIGPMSIEAALEAGGAKLNLREARVSVDGFTSLGAVEMLLREDAVPSVSGTLAFERLDLTGFAEAIAPMPQTIIDLQRPLRVDYVDSLDLDLRISAGAGTVGPMPFSDLAATVKFKEGVATLDIGDATILSGTAQARMSVDGQQRPAAASGFVSLDGVDTSSLFAAVGIKGFGISGISDVDAIITAPVTNWADVFRRNRIALDLNTRQGVISGFDPAVLSDGGTTSFAAASGTTVPFESMRAKLQSTGSLVDVQSLAIRTDTGSLDATGSVSTSTNRLDLSGTIAPTPEAAVATAAPAEPTQFRLQGIWPHPTITAGPAASPM